MPRAAVAYESTAEARRKLKALKPLRWHRTASGLEAKGARGKYVLVQRSPDRRHGVFPWSLRQGGAKGPEVKIGGFDLVAQGKEFAVLFDHGLCGAPPQPEGVYRGTVAGEAGNSAYARKVSNALMNMGVDANMVDSSEDYLRRMEVAGLDPVIVASVLVATKEHRHVHDCPEKHVELSEAGEARRRKGVPPIFQSLQQRLDAGGYPTVNWPPFHIYYVGGDKYQNGPDARGALRNFRLEGNKERVTKIVAVDMSGGMGPQDVNHQDFIYYISPDDTLEMGPNGGAAEGGSKAFHAAKSQLAAVGYTIQKTGWDDYRVTKKGERDPEAGYFTTDLDDAVVTGRQMASGVAMETKKRLWQPDPSTGLFITHSSLTRDWWLMRGDSLEGRFTSRGEAEQAAKDFSKGASENRRPKG